MKRGEIWLIKTSLLFKAHPVNYPFPNGMVKKLDNCASTEIFALKKLNHLELIWSSEEHNQSKKIQNQSLNKPPEINLYINFV